MTVGGVGLLFGLRFRVPMVLVTSIAVVPVCVIVAVLAQWSLLSAIAFTLGLLSALQCGYLIGLLLTCAVSRLGAFPK